MLSTLKTDLTHTAPTLDARPLFDASRDLVERMKGDTLFAAKWGVANLPGDFWADFLEVLSEEDAYGLAYYADLSYAGTAEREGNGEPLLDWQDRYAPSYPYQA